jgi:hypothetical protein
MFIPFGSVESCKARQDDASSNRYPTQDAPISNLCPKSQYPAEHTRCRQVDVLVTTCFSGEAPPAPPLATAGDAQQLEELRLGVSQQQ